MKKILYLSVFNILFSSIQFNTPWGDCSVNNDQETILDSSIQKIILTQINNLNSQFSKLCDARSFPCRPSWLQHHVLSGI